MNHQAFSGFEDEVSIPTGIMGCEKGFPLFKELLHYYDNRHFILPNGAYDVTTNVVTITNMCLKYGFVANNIYQEIAGFALYPNDFFCPKSYETGKITITDNTVTIHHFAGFWLTTAAKKSKSIQEWGKNHKVYLLGKIIAFPWTVIDRIQTRGVKDTWVHYLRKIMFWKKGKRI